MRVLLAADWPVIDVGRSKRIISAAQRRACSRFGWRRRIDDAP